MAAQTPIWIGSSNLNALTGKLAHTPESGAFKYAERITYTTQLAGRYADAFAYANDHHRGAIFTLTIKDTSTSGDFCVEDTSLESQKGGKAIVTVNYLYLGVVPVDEFALTPFEITPPIERNGYFSVLTENDIQIARQIYNSATQAGASSLTNWVTGTTNYIKATDLVYKWFKGQETYYLSGLKFQHTLYSFTAPTASPGGFIQTPTGAFATYISDAGMSWLRQSDEVLWSNGLWKLTRTWLGAPAGHWDTDLYPPA